MKALSVNIIYDVHTFIALITHTAIKLDPHMQSSVALLITYTQQLRIAVQEKPWTLVLAQWLGNLSPRGRVVVNSF